MSDKTGIEWTDATWNPTTGCTKVSPGCDHCYAETMHERFNGKGSFATVELHPDRLDKPLHWKKPRRIFVNSMSDLFHAAVPEEFIVEVFARMWWSPQHTFQILTKRHGRMLSLVPRIEAHLRERERDLALVDCPTPLTWPLPNVWLGVSVESQQWADIRVPALLETPAAVRWISAEPLLGPVALGSIRGVAGRYGHAGFHRGSGEAGCPRDLHHHHDERCRFPLDWVVVGGESGPGARPMERGWARSLRDQCTVAGVPFLFKQWGAHAPRCTLALSGTGCSCNGSSPSHPAVMKRVGKKAAGRELDGRTWDQYPAGVA